ncbi:Tat pathway signal sequence domain protein [Streptomyces sp. NPDC126514]|uniref:Tat pathway signal sequence domain protein n=1 Tax=Streptomyces sp. NPDC126514 TaxID=3155210 RepID=UPI003325FF04
MPPPHPHRTGTSRRGLLGAAVGGLAATALPASLQLPSGTATAATPAGSWVLRWSPSPSSAGLGAFETIEDDRADSHTGGQPHIYPVGDTFRFNMHLADRDTSTDRQRHEVTGMRTSGSSYLRWLPGETWRTTYRMYIPSSLKATTSFTHIMQTKQPGTGTSPITVMSLRRVNGVQTIELKLFEADILVGRTDLAPLHNAWVDVDFRMKIGDGAAGSVRWILRKNGSTLVDATRTGVDTFLLDRVRPKWGIYRSLSDTSGSLQDCYLLLRNMRGYQWVDGPATVN